MKKTIILLILLVFTENIFTQNLFENTNRKFNVTSFRNLQGVDKSYNIQNRRNILNQESNNQFISKSNIEINKIVFTRLDGKTYETSNLKNWHKSNFNGFGTDLMESNIQHRYKIIQNPVEDILQIENCFNSEILIFSMMGEMMYKGVYINSMNVSSYQTGLYYVLVDKQFLKFIKK